MRNVLSAGYWMETVFTWSKGKLNEFGTFSACFSVVISFLQLAKRSSGKESLMTRKPQSPKVSSYSFNMAKLASSILPAFWAKALAAMVKKQRIGSNFFIGIWLMSLLSHMEPSFSVDGQWMPSKISEACMKSGSNLEKQGQIKSTNDRKTALVRTGKDL